MSSFYADACYSNIMRLYTPVISDNFVLAKCEGRQYFCSDCTVGCTSTSC